jgi:hypothetical protein
MVSKPSGQEGYALLIALIAIFLVSFALSLVGDGLALRSRTAQAEAAGVHLAALTDGALAEALAGLSQSVGYPGATSHALGTGTISSQVTRLNPQTFQIDVYGLYAGQKRHAMALVLLNAGSLQVISWRRGNLGS